MTEQSRAERLLGRVEDERVTERRTLSGDLDWLFATFEDNSWTVQADRCVGQDEYDEMQSERAKAWRIVCLAKVMLGLPPLPANDEDVDDRD